MINLTRGLIIGGVALTIGTTSYISATGVGLGGIHNKEVIQAASRDCPSGRKDEFGNCIERNYRSAYYRSYYFDNSSYGKGK